jgi:hypothetical protein
VGEYLLRQRTQTKLDKWEPPVDDIYEDLRETVAGLGRLLGNEAHAVTVLDAAMMRHAKHLRATVGAIATLTDDISAWQALPGAAAAELLDGIRGTTEVKP